MATWPASLPQILEDDGWEETPPDLTIRTKMSSGPDKVRRRRTAGITQITGSIRLSRLQAKQLWDFYMKDCNAGAAPFDWDTEGVATITSFRFVVPPRIGSDGVNYIARLSLEGLP